MAFSPQQQWASERRPECGVEEEPPRSGGRGNFRLVNTKDDSEPLGSFAPVIWAALALGHLELFPLFSRDLS